MLRIPLLMISSLKNFLSRPRLILLSLGPATIALFTFLGLVFGVGYFSFDISAVAFGTGEGWLAWLSSLFVFIVGLLVSAILSWVFSLILGGWFLEQIAFIGLQDAGVQEAESPDGFVKATLRSLVDESWKAILIGLIALITFSLAFIPPLALVAAGIGFFLVGFELLDLPLSLQGLSFRERRALLLQKKLTVLAMGGLFTALLLIPFGFLFVPAVFHYLAARTAGEWLIPDSCCDR